MPILAVDAFCVPFNEPRVLGGDIASQACSIYIHGPHIYLFFSRCPENRRCRLFRHQTIEAHGLNSRHLFGGEQVTTYSCKGVTLLRYFSRAHVGASGTGALSV